jgi:hypothetical protein
MHAGLVKRPSVPHKDAGGRSVTCSRYQELILMLTGPWLMTVMVGAIMQDKGRKRS